MRTKMVLFIAIMGSANVMVGKGGSITWGTLIARHADSTTTMMVLQERQLIWPQSK